MNYLHPWKEQRLGGRAIRSTRLRKFRKKHKSLLFIWKSGLVWYLFIFSVLNFSHQHTNAIFIGQAETEFSLEAGTWWDKSSLKFTNEYGGDCNEIYAYVRNAGSGDMGLQSKYYVYYSPTGNPVNPQGISGQLVFTEGLISKMPANSTSIRIAYQPKDPGFYKFVAFQHPNKPGENGHSLTVEGTPVIFSELIKVGKCMKP